MADTHIKEELQSIQERTEVEVIAERVPAIAALIEKNNEYLEVMRRTMAVVSRYNLSIFVDPETGLTVEGVDPEMATREVKEAFELLRATIIKNR